MSRRIIQVEVEGVQKRRHPGKHYVYIVYVTWSDGGPYIIYRRYSRFFDLQSTLLDMFPIEAGSVEPSSRIIPILPGKIIFGRSHIRDVAVKRLRPIDEYCKALMNLPAKISQCEDVQQFFEVEAEDLEPPVEEKKSNAEPKAEKISKPKQLKQYVAVANYEKQERGEISLQEAMVVEVAEMSESGWWFVNGEDEQGWVPSTYLHPVEGAKENTAKRANPGEEERYTCIETFRTEGEDEIALEKGAVVEVIEKNLEGWWLVRYQGKEGWTPATYLVKTRDAFAQSIVEKGRASGVQIIGTLSDVSNLLKAKENEEEEEAGKELEAGKSDLNQDNKFQFSAGPKGDMYAKVVKSKSLERGGSLRPPPRQNSIEILKESSPAPASPTKPAGYVTIADFEDTVGDGISFMTGEKVSVLEKTSSGWWFVRIRDKEGWIPSSYIQEDSSSLPNQLESHFEEEEEDEFEDDSDEEPSQLQNPRLNLAAALQSNLKSRNSTTSQSSVSSSQETGHTKPSGPKSGGGPGRPALPPKIPSSGSAFSRSHDSNSAKQKNDTAQSSFKDKSGEESSEFGGSGVTNVLKAKFEARQKQWESPSVEKSSNNQAKFSSHTKGSLPAKPLLPKKTTGGKSWSGDFEEGVTVRSLTPSKPSQNRADSSSLDQKPSFKKPAPPQKLPSASRNSNAAFPKAGRPSVSPPKIPTNPPGRGKIGASWKHTSDSNNNDRNSKETSPAGNVHGITAALKSKFENTGTSSAKPQPPAKIPGKIRANSNVGNIAASWNKGSVSSTKHTSGSKGHVDKAKSSVGNIAANWNKSSVSSTKQTSGPKDNVDGGKVIGASGNVGGLVSALSDKLNFGAEQQNKHHSGLVQGTEEQHTHAANPVHVKHQRGNNCEKYIASAQFDASNDGEMSLEQGQEVEVLDKASAGWWLVRLADSEEGWVPSSYLYADSTSHHQAKQLPKVPASAPKLGSKVQYKTVCMFTAENEGEVGFDEGEVVEILEKSESGWWLIGVNGEEGWAPSDFIKEETVQVRGGGSKPPPPPKNKPMFKI